MKVQETFVERNDRSPTNAVARRYRRTQHGVMITTAAPLSTVSAQVLKGDFRTDAASIVAEEVCNVFRVPDLATKPQPENKKKRRYYYGRK